MPRFVGQEARKRAKEPTKRRAEEVVSEFGSSSEDEEEEDPITLSSNEEEYEGSETPSHSDPIDDSKPPPFEIRQPTIRSLPRRPTARPKRKATPNKPEGPSSGTKKKHRG